MSKVPSQGVKRGVVTNIQEVVGAIQQAVDDVKQNRMLISIMFLLELPVSIFAVRRAGDKNISMSITISKSQRKTWMY